MNLKKLNSKELSLAVFLMLIGLVMFILGPGGTLDGRFFYTASEAETYLRGLSASRAEAYLWNELMDLFFLTTYSLLFFFLARRRGSRKPWIALAPGGLDLIETITILVLLLNKTWNVPIWLGYITGLKWTAGITVGTSIAVGFARQNKKSERAGGHSFVRHIVDAAS